MSTEVVQLSAPSDEAQKLQAMLAVTYPRIEIVAATPTRVVSFQAVYQDDDFVLAGGAVGGPVVTCGTGPAAGLPGAIGQLLQALSAATSIPLTPRFGQAPVLVPDALVLAEDVRAGALDDLVTALRVAHLDRVPTWLSDMAHGVCGTFLVLVTDAQTTRIGLHLVGLPSGWGVLNDTGGALSMTPRQFGDVLVELNEVCLIAASLVVDL